MKAALYIFKAMAMHHPMDKIAIFDALAYDPTPLKVKYSRGYYAVYLGGVEINVFKRKDVLKEHLAQLGLNYSLEEERN